MIRAIVLLTVTVVLMASARSFLPAGDVPIAAPGVALGFGFIVLAALQTGTLFASMRLPRLTGYLLTGVLCGPEVGRLLTARMVEGLGVVNGVAIGLIALSAGVELNLSVIKPRLRSIAVIGAVALAFAMVATTLTTLLLAQRLPFLQGMNGTQRLAVAITLGVVFASLSPAVAIAILEETHSAGPVSESVLGVVVLADIAIIVLFAIVHSLAAGVFGVAAAAGGMQPVMGVMIEVFGSMLVGVVVSIALALYIRRVKTRFALFVLAVCFVCAQVGAQLHLDVLIICLTAGLLLENVWKVKGETVHRALGPAVLPVFAVFFAVAGARLHVHELRVIGPLAVVFVAVRAGSLFAGARIGASMANAEPAVRRWMPFGTLPQAGVSVGLAVLIERHFTTWGGAARGLILSVITLNELIGPVLLRMALVRAGEAGKRKNT
ncbi:MAG: cation:proton antiporter [Deltaproteobacteria bacterium]